MITNILLEEPTLYGAKLNIKTANGDEDAGSHDSDSTCE